MEKHKRNSNPVVVDPNVLAGLYDFHICAEYEELAQTLDYINRSGYRLITVTQDNRGFFTVFFRRSTCG